MNRHTIDFRSPILAAFVAVAGCGSQGPSAVDASATDSALDDHSIRLAMSFSLAAGQEQHLCSFVRLPKSEGEILVSGRSHQYTPGNHHFGIFRLNVPELPDGQPLDQPFDCFQSDAGKYATTFVVLEQAAQSDVDFPAGTALPFRSEEVLMLQMHGLNASAEPLEEKLSVTLKTTTADQVVHRLGLLQFYDPFIYVPPMGTGRANLRCKIPSDITLLEANTHFHPRGTHEEVFIDLAGQAPAAAPLLANDSWDHPTAWRGSLAVPAGSSAHFSCSYQNGDAHSYIQGQDKITNEMCMVWGYYYPALDAAFEGCLPPTYATDYGTGDKTCGQVTACIQTCPPGDAPRGDGLKVDVGECFQKCVADTCPSATAPFLAESVCVQNNCAAECNGGNGCGACVIAKCADVFSACQQHTCP